MNERPKVLVKERIADAGVELLRDRFEVELGLDWDGGELQKRIGEFDAILIRSATDLDSGLIERAERLKVIGRAGTGVDNVDVEAATKRGIVVANAPEANAIAAAEHTMALMLALCRNIPQAHASLTSGNGSAPASRAPSSTARPSASSASAGSGSWSPVAPRASRCRWSPTTSSSPPSGFASSGSTGSTPEELYARSDFITLHLPKTPETVNCHRRRRRSRGCARGCGSSTAPAASSIDLDALVDGLESGRVAGAALDVFPEEPFSGHPILERDDVVVTPHLGASTAEAQDRAGVVTAEQVTAALTGGVVTTAVNIAAVRPEVMEQLAPFVPLCEKLGALAQALGDGAPDRVEVEFLGRLADQDTRILGIAVLAGILRGHTEEAVNLVNAPHLAEERGIELLDTRDATSPDFTELIVVRLRSGDETTEVAGTGVGPRNIPYLARVWGEDFYLPFAEHLAIFRYTDQPGMIGRVGTIFGEEDVNIVSAAVGAEPDGDTAVMALTTDAPVNPSTIDRILELEGFSIGRAVSL